MVKVRGFFVPMSETFCEEVKERIELFVGEGGGAVSEVLEVIFGAFVGDGEGIHLDGEEGDGGDAEVGFGTGGTDLEDFVVRGDKEVIGVAAARGIAVVAEVGAEFGIEVIEVGFVFDKDLLNSVLERDGPDVDVLNIVFFDGSKTGADDIAVFYVIGLNPIVGEGIAF